MFTLDKFRPINNQILIKVDKKDDTDRYETASGIAVIDSSRPKDRDTIATIIKVGNRMKDRSGNVIDLKSIFKEGDKILYYNPAGGTKIELEGQEYILIRAEDIDCIIEED